MNRPQEYKIAFPPEHAGTVIGKLTILGVEVKLVERVTEDLCSLTVDLDLALARRFHEWLQDTTHRQCTMSPDVWIKGVPTG
jgi:hypothetical protein